MFSAIVSESNRAPDWKTMVTFLRMRPSSALRTVGDVFVRHDHAPVVGLEESHHVAEGHGLARHRERPMIATVSPAAT